MLVNVQTLKVNQTEGRRFETRNKAKNRSVPIRIHIRKAKLQSRDKECWLKFYYKLYCRFSIWRSYFVKRKCKKLPPSAHDIWVGYLVHDYTTDTILFSIDFTIDGPGAVFSSFSSDNFWLRLKLQGLIAINGPLINQGPVTFNFVKKLAKI